MNVYESRLRRVHQYIWDNPAGDLSLDALADVAALSRFHFHRVYQALTGETAAQAVRRLRLHRAAYALTRCTGSVAQIAAEVGYDNPDSFKRAFRAQYGATPAAFRKAGIADLQTLHISIGEPNMYPTEIRALPALRLATLPHRGAYHQIGRAFTDLGTIFTARNLWAPGMALVGLYYDAPGDVPEEDLRSAAGVTVDEAFDMPDDLTEVRYPAGQTLILTVKGPYTTLPAAWQTLYASVLPASDQLPGNDLPYEFYLNNPQDTAPEDLLTEIRVLLAA
ncbi:AraC family transcriptional regulator [Sagittula sp. S175]|uniref:AraC family transcriptional regulator n=1 Tax=Sagittula sp. S175 TaxID=3415129 RepID=UPI003C7A1060